MHVDERKTGDLLFTCDFIKFVWFSSSSGCVVVVVDGGGDGGGSSSKITKFSSCLIMQHSSH